MSYFHYSTEAPSDAIFSSFQTLSKFSNEQFLQLLTITFQLLSDPNKSAQTLSQLEEFAEGQGFGVSAVRNVFKSFLSVLHSAIRRNLSASQLREDFVNLGLSEEKSEKAAEQWGANLIGLSRVAAGQTLMVNQLVDMEWKFGVTAASSEMQTVGSTFIQMKLVVSKGANKTENVFMELSLPEFYSFLHEMERAKASLDHLS